MSDAAQLTTGTNVVAEEPEANEQIDKLKAFYFWQSMFTKNICFGYQLFTFIKTKVGNTNTTIDTKLK